MRVLGVALSYWGLRFISAKANRDRDGSHGEVVCETQEQCDAIASRAAIDGWSITTRVATVDEVADAKRWSEML